MQVILFCNHLNLHVYIHYVCLPFKLANMYVLSWNTWLTNCFYCNENYFVLSALYMTMNKIIKICSRVYSLFDHQIGSGLAQVCWCNFFSFFFLQKNIYLYMIWLAATWSAVNVMSLVVVNYTVCSWLRSPQIMSFAWCGRPRFFFVLFFLSILAYRCE